METLIAASHAEALGFGAMAWRVAGLRGAKAALRHQRNAWVSSSRLAAVTAIERVLQLLREWGIEVIGHPDLASQPPGFGRAEVSSATRRATGRLCLAMTISSPPCRSTRRDK